jgi:hypothetical protein
MVMGVRAEDVLVEDTGVNRDVEGDKAIYYRLGKYRIRHGEPWGHVVRIHLDNEGVRSLVAICARGQSPPPGEPVEVMIKADRIHWFQAGDEGRRLPCPHSDQSL